MFFKPIACLALALSTALPAQAQDWKFRFKPDPVSAAHMTYAAVTSGTNTLHMHDNGEDRGIAVTVVIEEQDAFGYVSTVLLSEVTPRLDIYGATDRYMRNLQQPQFTWEHEAPPNKTRIRFLLTKKDAAALTQSHTVAVTLGANTYRWPSNSIQSALKSIPQTRFK